MENNINKKPNNFENYKIKILNPEGKDITQELLALADRFSDEEGFVRAGEVFSLFGIQTQYGSYYFRGIGQRPNLSEGLNYKKDSINYHGDKIHKDDIIEMANRLSETLIK